MVLLGQDLTPLFAGFLFADEELLALAGRERPQLIAIDAPLALPRGLDCLEESCPCGAGGYPLRQAEREMAQQGIGCFFTTKKSIIKGMVYRGIALSRELSRQRHRVIEVYPYGSKVRLWGKPPPGKARGPGWDWVHHRLGEVLPSPRPLPPALDHHLCDAAIAAYTAWLHSRGATQVLGGGEDGEIILPGAPSWSLTGG